MPHDECDDLCSDDAFPGDVSLSDAYPGGVFQHGVSLDGVSLDDVSGCVYHAPLNAYWFRGSICGIHDEHDSVVQL
ncbi:hypothetical protein [Yersinia pestis]|uniref:hypothetical protein n=1 Tax=Yersinia pestis TaxID=632 RepID=UPI001C2CFBD0|nr:hypothetical protein [Yersinia pestis]MBT8690761.1 hypothetical protein [Yersinia pestis]